MESDAKRVQVLRARYGVVIETRKYGGQIEYVLIEEMPFSSLRELEGYVKIHYGTVEEAIGQIVENLES